MRATNKTPKPRKTIAIVVDGECEFWYFQMMKRNEPTLSVDIEPTIPQKKKLEEQYSRVVELSKHYDKVFWLIDFDKLNEESRTTPRGRKSTLQAFKEYYSKLRKVDNIEVMVNNPCLEYWFLLHFEATGRFFETCSEVLRTLKLYLSDYEKTEKYFTRKNNDVYLRLRPNLQTAILNAGRLGRIDLDNPHSAISEMFLLFSKDIQLLK